MDRAGRRFAYSPSVWRSVTLTLRKPAPTGVVMGPLSATLLRRIDSRTWSGSGVPYWAITASPASTTSHSNETPDASRTRRVASASSGPMPSPGISVTWWGMTAILSTERSDRGRRLFGRLGGPARRRHRLRNTPALASRAPAEPLPDDPDRVVVAVGDPFLQ